MLVHALQLTSLSVKLKHKYRQQYLAKAWNQFRDTGYVPLQECAFDNCLQQCGMDTVCQATHMTNFKQFKVGHRSIGLN